MVLLRVPTSSIVLSTQPQLCCHEVKYHCPTNPTNFQHTLGTADSRHDSEHVNENMLCFSASACPNLDANTWGQKRARREQTRVSKEVPSSDDTWLILD
eukprot:738710-Pelagomonas_calceolata.AAC.1